MATVVAAVTAAPVIASPTTPASSCPSPARRLSLRAEAAEVLMASIDFDETQVASRWVRALGVGGVTFFGTPDASVGAVGGGRARSAATGGLRPFTAVDEEGGRVQRLAAVLGRIPSARQMAATMSPAAVRVLAARHASAMHRLGFDVDLAPDMDVTSALTGVIGDRSFSGNVTTASVYGRAFAAGLARAGCWPPPSTSRATAMRRGTPTSNR